MNLRTPCTLLAVAAIAAAALTVFFGDEPLDERVVRAEMEHKLPRHADALHGYPLAVRLALLDYADDEELVLNARLALLRHPQAAPRVIALYGGMPEFRAILRQYGAAIIPPIDYFLHHEPATLRMVAMVTPTPEPGGQPAADVLDGDGSVNAPGDDSASALTSVQRGAYAIHFIGDAGYDFLGQFVTTPAGEAEWVQSERFATGVKRFFTSGLTRVETQWRLGEDITPAEYAWATVDIMVPVAIFKLARAGRAATGVARSSRGLAAGATTATRTSATLGRTGRLVAVGGTLAGIGYVVMNPGVLNSIGRGLAEAVGLPPWLVAGAIWFVLLLPVLIVLRIGQRWLLRPLYAATVGLIRLLSWMRRWLASAMASRQGLRAGSRSAAALTG